MNKHDERAREWLEHDGGSDSEARRNALAAEFAEVERVAMTRIDAAAGVASALDAWEAAGVTPRATLIKRIATLEAALGTIDAYYSANNGVMCNDPSKCDEPEFCAAWGAARAALSGEPTALLDMLEKAVMEAWQGRGYPTEGAASKSVLATCIAKRVAGVE